MIEFVYWYVIHFISLTMKRTLDEPACDCVRALTLDQRFARLKMCYASAGALPIAEITVKCSELIMWMGAVVGWPLGVVLRLVGDDIYWATHVCER